MRANKTIHYSSFVIRFDVPAGFAIATRVVFAFNRRVVVSLRTVSVAQRALLTVDRTLSVGLLLIPFLFTATACAAHYTVHPGALNKTDSTAYDTLLIAETAIDQARMDYRAGQLPASIKPALDALIDSYNVARQAWLTYRGAIATNVRSDDYFNPP